MEDDDHLRDDPELAGGPEFSSIDDIVIDEDARESRRSSWLRPLMMTAAERWDFDLE